MLELGQTKDALEYLRTVGVDLAIGDRIAMFDPGAHKSFWGRKGTVKELRDGQAAVKLDGTNPMEVLEAWEYVSVLRRLVK
jgi:hypothetical protein